MTMRDLLLEQVFSLLEEATKLERAGKHRIEAATKYYESCYLMRRIVANAENNQLNDSHSSSIGASSRRLLQDKIDHYTIRARTLYFEESAAGTKALQANRTPSNKHSQPTTSIMIELLDDAISVLTEVPSVPPPRSVPLIGLSIQPETSNGVVSQPRMPHRTNQARNNNHLHHRSNSKPKNQWNHSKTPRCALATTERRIHLQANLAHSILSQAMDLDEQRNPQQAIASYVEASELYLSTIQMGNQHIRKLETMHAGIQRRPSGSCGGGSSKELVDTMCNSLQALLQKLKQLVSSTLDRIEILKIEQRCKGRYPKDSSKSSAISLATKTSTPSFVAAAGTRPTIVSMR